MAKFSAAVVLFLAGCGSPNTANIQLRKQISDLQTKVEDLDRRHDADQQTIAGMKGATSVPTLPEDRVAKLFTAQGLKFGRLTGGADLDRALPGHEGLKVYVVPTDDQGQQLKAAGSFVIDAFDLAQGAETRVGHWTFDLDQSRQSWNGLAMLYSYVLTCPWQTVPQHEALTLRVTFSDALTGRQITAQREVKIKPPLAKS